MAKSKAIPLVIAREEDGTEHPITSHSVPQVGDFFFLPGSIKPTRKEVLFSVVKHTWELHELNDSWVIQLVLLVLPSETRKSQAAVAKLKTDKEKAAGSRFLKKLQDHNKKHGR